MLVAMNDDPIHPVDREPGAAPTRSSATWPWLGGLVLGALLLPAPTLAQTHDSRLKEFFEQHLEETLRAHPVRATFLGDHRFDHLLNDLSPRAIESDRERIRRARRTLHEAVDYAKLSRSSQIDFEILDHELKTDLWLAEKERPFETDPRVYGRFITDSVYALFTQSTLPKSENIANALARMKQIPGVIEAAKLNLKNPPRVVTRTAVRQNQGAAEFFRSGLATLIGDTDRREEIMESGAAVAGALEGFQTFLENDLLPRANGDWRVGRAQFSEKLALVLNANVDADDVLADARAEFTRVHRNMYVIARQLWSRYSSGAPLPPDDEAGRVETIERVLNRIGQEHGAPETLVRDARATVAELKNFIAANSILGLPEPDRCEIIEMPEFQRGNSIAFLNAAPPLDSETISIYAISPPPADWTAARVKSFLEEYNRHMLKILTIHEAYPGHYVQLEYANANPSLIRKIHGSGVYNEGWAVYTEQMMLDQGYGDADLALRLTQLKFYLRAVANAILDHEMHCTGMTDDEALAFLTERAFQSEGEARLKIIRSKQSSVQLSSYFVGRMAFYRLRQSEQRRLGNRFDLGDFHERVLRQGSVPVKYLPELVAERTAPTR